MTILRDDDIAHLLTYGKVIPVMEGLLRSKRGDNVVHPPRYILPTEGGSLTFTVGEVIDKNVAGFRFYGSPKTTQLTVAVDTQSGEFKGLIIGTLIGVIRTACLNAVAIKYLARQDAQTLGVLGSGLQARHHALAALEVRDFKALRLYSRDPANAEACRHFIEARLPRGGVDISIEKSPEDLLRACDVLISATNSSTPILSAKDLRPGLHINNVGPKYSHKHELPQEAYDLADILTTDSIPQLFDTTGIGAALCTKGLERGELMGLEHYMSGFERRPEDITFFCSMGLAGSEVALADWVIEALKAEGHSGVYAALVAEP